MGSCNSNRSCSLGGSNGFSGMLNNLAAGNPGWVAHSITWNASSVYHDPVLSNSALRARAVPHRLRDRVDAIAQARAGALHRLVARRLVVRGGSRKHRPRGRHALRRRPRRRALLRPPGGTAVAERGLGPTVRRCSDRRGSRPRRRSGRWCGACWPSWRSSARVGRPRRCTTWWPPTRGSPDGLPASIGRLHRCSSITARRPRSCSPRSVRSWRSGSTFRRSSPRFTLVLGIVTFVFIWVATENFGGILAGGATDPNSGPLVIILALSYWPSGTGSKYCQQACPVELDRRVEGGSRPVTPTPFLAVLPLRGGDAGRGRLRARAAGRVRRHSQERWLGRRHRPPLHGRVHGRHVR
jgi:hypothetical protein